MPFQPGQIANPTGKNGQKPKPYRDALRIEAAALEQGQISAHPPGSLRAIAQMRLMTASSADGHADAKEVADRLDGKVPQGIGGDDELGPVQYQHIERTIVDPKNSDR